MFTIAPIVFLTKTESGCLFVKKIKLLVFKNATFPDEKKIICISTFGMTLSLIQIFF